MIKTILFTLVLSLSMWAGTDDTFLIRGANIHPVTGPEIQGGSILVTNGKISEIGLKVVPPKGVRVIEGKGLHVYPGIINSATELGISEISSVRETNDTGELGDFVPQVRALVAINAASEHFPVVRANGVTSAITLPASGGRGFGRGGNIIAGQAAMVHLDGWTWEEMAIKPSVAMQLIFPQIRSLPGRFAAMAAEFGQRAPGYTEAKREYELQIRKIDEFFEQARRYQRAKAAKDPSFRVDVPMEAMLPILDGKTPLMVQVDGERYIRECIQWADRQKVKIVLAGTRDFGNTLPELKAKGIAVILPPTLALPEHDDQPYDKAFTEPGEVYKAGVKFALATFDNQFARNLPYQAAQAVAFGLPQEEALKAITINAAEIWGVADQIGSIEKGKWADLMITDGDPLEIRTNVKQVFIKGKNVDLASKHTKLYEKYLARP
jgi:imidazolonepropionase-like amidohydrolase